MPDKQLERLQAQVSYADIELKRCAKIVSIFADALDAIAEGCERPKKVALNALEAAEKFLPEVDSAQ